MFVALRYYPRLFVNSDLAETKDQAIIKIDAILNSPVLQLQATAKPNASIIVEGFQQFGQNFLLRPLRGFLAGMISLESKNGVRVSAWDILVEDNFTLQKGYSGAPVIDKSTGNVLGLVSHRVGDGDRGIAISFDALHTFWKGIPDNLIHKPFHITEPRKNHPSLISLNRTPIFVGRQQHIFKLKNKFSEVLSGKGTTGFIFGEAGCGKSTLAIEFAKSILIDHPESVFCIGHISMISGQGNSYGPFKSILEQVLLCDNETIDPLGRKIEPLDIMADVLIEFGIQNLGPFSSFAGSATNSLNEKLRKRAVANPIDVNTLMSFDRDVIFDWYSKIVCEIATYFPLLIVVEDLQWADSSSLQLLLHLSRLIEHHSIMLIGTYRPGEANANRHLNDVLENIGRIGDSFRLNIRTAREHSTLLSTENTDFCENYLLAKYGTIFSRDFLDKIARFTSGNALFVSEFLLNLEEQKYIEYLNDEWRLHDVEQALNYIPTKIEHIMHRRLSRLEEPVTAAIKYASVEGEVFTVDVISSILNIDKASFLRTTVDQLLRIHRLVHETRTRRLQSGTRLHFLSFNHILTQRYIYEYLLTGIEREMYHEAVANNLEQIWAGFTADIAPDLTFHYSLARIPEKTVEYALKAAINFAQQFGWSEVNRFTTLGIQTLQEYPHIKHQIDDTVVVQHYLLYAKSEFEGGDYAQDIDHIQAGIDGLHKCLHLVDTLEPSLVADVYHTLGKLTATQGVTSQYYGNKYLEKALSIYQNLDDKRGVVETLSIYSFDTNLADQTAADSQLQTRLECLQLAEDLGDPILLSKCLCDLAIHYFNFDTDEVAPLEVAEEYAARSLEITSRLRNPIAEMYAKLVLSWVYHHRGYYGERLENLRYDLLTQAQKHGQTVFEADALTDVGHYHVFLVHTHNDADEIMKNALLFRTRMGRHTVHDCENYAGYLFRLGRFEEAISLLEKTALQQDHYRAFRTRCQIVRIFALTGKINHAQTLLQDIVNRPAKSSDLPRPNSPLMFAYIMLEDLTLARNQAKQLSTSVDSNFKRGIFHTYNDLATEIAEAYRLLGDIINATYWIGIARQNWDSMNSITNLNDLTMFWEHEYVRAKIMFDNGQLEESSDLFGKIKAVFYQINHYSEAELHLFIGKVFKQLLQMEEANMSFNESIVKATHYNIPSITVQAKHLMEQIA